MSRLRAFEVITTMTPHISRSECSTIIILTTARLRYVYLEMSSYFRIINGHTKRQKPLPF